MIGVFVSFTLSQAGMVRPLAHAVAAPGWRTSAAINGFGAIVTGIVLRHRGDDEGGRRRLDHHPDDPGARGIFEITRRHYDHVAAELTLRDWEPESVEPATSCIVPIGGIQRAVVKALRYARHAVGRRARGLRRDGPGRRRRRCASSGRAGARASQLVVLESPYRSLMEPLLEYIEQIQRDDPSATSR